ncbi:MAG: hypothetical protein AAGB01_07490 [Cyanobacteria bacterium P01_F01_bin.42]
MMPDSNPDSNSDSNRDGLVPNKSDELTVQIMDDESYQAQLDHNQALAMQDAQARERARRILKKCREGFVPNLIHGGLPYDGIFASKAVLKLLELSLREDGNCSPGARERQPFSRAETYALARHCGKKLNFIGGEPLMAQVLHDWIPAFDQPNLSETWTGIGDWSGQVKIKPSGDGTR